MNFLISAFENCFMDAVDKHAPFREVVIKKPVNPTWITDDLVKMMDSRDIYKKLFNQTNDTFFMTSSKN